VKERTFKGDRLWIQTLASYVGLSMIRDAAVASRT
jgi:hypothetical protein